MDNEERDRRLRLLAGEIHLWTAGDFAAKAKRRRQELEPYALRVMEAARYLLERDEARLAVQDAFGWWVAQSDVRPEVVMRFFDWAESRWPWMKTDLSEDVDAK